MKKIITCIVFFVVVTANAQNKFNANKKLLPIINQNFIDAAAQYKILMQQLPADKFPKTFHANTNQYEWANSAWWVSGFYSGTLLYLFQQTNDSVLLNEANSNLQVLKKEQYNKTTHDLGFMMYNSFGNANSIQHSISNDTILLNSAHSLASRFNNNVGCIKSWDGKPNEFLVIIDNMMNLKLLFWATHNSGDSSFYKIATTHANTTMANHFRENNSSYHVINYNKNNGEVFQKKTAQGFADESAWSRGQAWGLYGFTETYRETKDEKYLAQANKIAQFILNNKNLPLDKIPYWDFDADNIPNALRDASAAAIMASAFLELCTYVNKKQSKQYFKTAETIIKSLSTSTYKAAIGANGGFILQHSVGHFPQKTEVDVPLTYADYYFIEAMIRYKQLTNTL